MGSLAWACLLGFFLPGFLIARLLRSTAPVASAFPISLLVLFYGVFLLDSCGLPVRFGWVSAYELAVTAGLGGMLLRRRPAARGPDRSVRAPLSDTAARGRVLQGCVVVVGLVMLGRYIVQPLAGVDTPFRWDFLAAQLLGNGRLDFYPPLTPDDYHVYFFPDAIPPTVSIAYWWLYAAWGDHAPVLTAIPVLLTYVGTTTFTFHAAAHLQSRHAGYLAAAILASSPLFYRAVFMGQETGLTALSMAAMIFFLIAAEGPRDLRASVLGGLAASLGALSREYGWAWIGIGLVVLVWRRSRLGSAIVFTATAVAVAAPWYVRTWLRTGDPFYPLAPGSLFRTANPVFSEFLTVQAQLFGFSTYSTGQWWAIMRFVLGMAPLPLVLGLAVGVWSARRWGLLVAAGLLVGVWLLSIGNTAGGVLYSTRVLNPALVVLSLLVAIGIAPATNRRTLGWLVTAVVVLSTCWTLANAVAFPMELRLRSFADALRAVPRRQILPCMESELQGLVSRLLPPGTRILSDNAYAHAALRGAAYDLVPTWSPEVAFLFDPGVDTTEARRLLHAHHITAGLFTAGSPINYFYRKYRYFTEEPLAWTILAPTATGLLVRLPAPSDAAKGPS